MSCNRPQKVWSWLGSSLYLHFLRKGEIDQEICKIIHFSEEGTGASIQIRTPTIIILKTLILLQ